MKIPNWQHNSNKPKKGRGIAKGRLKARRQALASLKAKHMDSSRTGTRDRQGPFSMPYNNGIDKRGYGVSRAKGYVGQTTGH
jgi:hypothetical protein